MRAHFLVALVALAPAALAQDREPIEPRLAQPEVWEFSGNLFYSDPPGSEDRLTPILYADRGPLHIEARYNYEDLRTLAVFGGWTFTSEGEEEGALSASATPMLGVVTGDTDGLAPGLELDLGWRDFAWYAESEYLFDRDDSDDDFFYSWSTLTYGFTDWMAAGLVLERSKLVDTDWSLQRGLALELGLGRVGLALYAYNLGSDDSYATVALELAP